MHILFIAPTLPIPSSGGRTRLFNLVKQLAERHEVSVLSFIRSREYGQLPSIEPYCDQLELVPIEDFQVAGGWRNRLVGWGQIFLSKRPRYVRTFPITDLIRPLSDLVAGGDIDVVVLHHLFVVELRDILGEIPSILAEDNIESGIARKAYERPSHLVHRLRNWLMWRKLLLFESRWIRRFKVCIAVSNQDADVIRRMSPNTEVHVVPNGVNIRQFASPRSERSQRNLLFFGTLSYGPNADGITWFCREVLPRVRNRIPEIELDITGIDSTPRIMQLASQTGVNVLGFVPDIRERLWSATATVVPLHVAGGTRLKILEAMAAECPVVSTTIGAEGLGVIDGKHLLIADEAEAFATAIVNLVASPKMRREMAILGRKFVSEHYDWRTITPKLEEACRRAIALNAEKMKQ